MSDYPPTPSYGASYGSRDQTNPPYVPPNYPNQYLQLDDGRTGQAQMASNYDTSMSAYAYDNSMPSFSASALASGAPPLPIFQGWNQDSIPLPPYTAPHNNTQYGGYSGHSYHNPQSYVAGQQQSYQQNARHVKPYDEGELSEGEFEDAYGPKNPATTVGDYGSTYYRNDGTGYVDTSHRTVYGGGQDYDAQPYAQPGNDYNYSREPPQVGRQQSDSYSPYAPSPAGNNEHSKANPNHNTSVQVHVPEQPVSGISQIQLQPTRIQNRASDSPRPNSQAIGNSVLKNQEKPDELAFAPAKHVPTVMKSKAVNGGSYTSVADARKKAQAAILNLWPYEVRFRNYVDEGFDENIVGRLFDDLGMSRAPSKTVNGTSPLPKVAEAQISVSDMPGGSRQENVVPTSTRNGFAAQLRKVGDKVEEPKAMGGSSGNQHPLNESAPHSSAPRSTNSTTIATSIKATEPTDKEKTLQLKMEALRKSRENRAQKAAAKTDAKPSTVPSPAAQPEPPKPATIAKTPSSPSSSNLPMTQLRSMHRPAPSSPPHVVNVPQAPVIPGLFLASTSSPAPSPGPHSTLFGPTQSGQRKRPVAADFDTPASTVPFKRPFGQSRNDQPLVIHVSDDEPESEDEDVAMDLDSQADQESPVQATRKVSDHRTTVIQNLPPLSNFPIRKTLNSPPVSSAASTPPVYQAASKAALGHPEVLQQKVTEIEILKRKIVEAEAKAKRKAQQTASGARTPQILEANGSSGVGSNNGDIAGKIEASIQMQLGTAKHKVSAEQNRPAEAQSDELAKAADLKRDEAESRRLRREKIATDLPRVDEEVQQDQFKLEQLRAEMAKLEATVRRNLENKRRLAEEMERLGQDAEDRLQDQRDEPKLPADVEKATTSGSSHPTSLPAASTDIGISTIPSTVQAQSLRTISPVIDQPATESTASSINSDQEAPALPSGSSALSSNPPPDHQGSIDVLSQTKDAESNDGITPGQAQEAAAPEGVHPEADSHAEVEDGMDSEDSYAPDPIQAQESTARTIDEKGSPPHNAGLDNTKTDQAHRESDLNEPPDATLLTDTPSPNESPPFSPAPPDLDWDRKPNILHDSTATEQAVDENNIGELQMNGSVPRLAEDGTKKISNETQFFTPYESPLKHFRAFRFHSDFNKEVSGGLRSLTYSHKINPNVELCRYELAGGVCNDSTCEFQHFRDIGLPEDSILTALGSPEEFPVQQQQKFREGLRQVLTALRARKVRDFDTIAAEVVAHRSKFLGDPSKVLMLEGTSI